LPLIPVEEFLALRPEYADSDDDERMFARIEHEREEREILEQRRQELLKRKQKLIAENKRRKDDLANLDQDLEKFIDVRSYIIYHFSLFPINFYTNSPVRPQNLFSNYSKRHLEIHDCLFLYITFTSCNVQL
jgi:hypothetical protein